MVLLCGGARSGPGDGAPDSGIEAFLSRSESGRKGLLEAASRPFLSDVRHADTAIDAPDSGIEAFLEVRKRKKGLARGCFANCCFTGSESDVRESGRTIVG